MFKVCPICETFSGFVLASCGNCINCNKEISACSYKLCYECSVVLNKCYFCGESIKTNEEYAEKLKQKIKENENMMNQLNKSPTINGKPNFSYYKYLEMQSKNNEYLEKLEKLIENNKYTQ